MDFALAGVAQWTEHQPVNPRVAGSIPSQGRCLSYRPGPQWGATERQPHIDVSFPLSPSFSLSLKRNEIFLKNVYWFWREREKERNISGLLLIHAPARDWTRNLGMCSDWESDPQPFDEWDDAPTNWATPARASVIDVLKMVCLQQSLLSAVFPDCLYPSWLLPFLYIL